MYFHAIVYPHIRAGLYTRVYVERAFKTVFVQFFNKSSVLFDAVVKTERNVFCHIFTFCFHWLNKIFHMKVCFSPCCFLKYIISQRNQAPFVIFVENIFFEIFYIVKI